jgi:hypothetical protein
MCTSVTLSVGSKVTTKSDHQKPWLNMNEPVRVATTAWRRSWRASWRRVRPGRSRRRCRGSGTMSRHWSHSSPPFPGFERPHSVGGGGGPEGQAGATGENQCAEPAKITSSPTRDHPDNGRTWIEQISAPVGMQRMLAKRSRQRKRYCANPNVTKGKRQVRSPDHRRGCETCAGSVAESRRGRD